MMRMAVLGLTLLALVGCAAQPPPAAPRPQTGSLPGWRLDGSAVRARTGLRGYGALVAEQRRWTSPGGGVASCLRITAEDPSRALLVLAKYASDLRSLGGVIPVPMTVGGRSFEAVDVPDQGRILAVAAGAEVLILAAADPGDLAGLAEAAVAPLGDAATSRSETTVPAWLDAFDRHGFRFYYRPWELPAGVRAQAYDPRGEFDYARDQDAGMVFWASLSEQDAHAGGTNHPWWDFARRAQTRRGQPWTLNVDPGVPTWVLNRHNAEIQRPAPQFCGGSHDMAQSWCAASRSLSWSSVAGKDEVLAGLQGIVRRHRDDPLLLDHLEPHGELRHGEHDALLEYGPVADASFRDFLRRRNGELGELARRWGMGLRSWDDVHVPELAEFLGWGPGALDLAGAWRCAFAPAASTALPQEWFAADHDDAGWPRIVAPGDDAAMFRPQRPAVLRRVFELPEDWPQEGAGVWLYVWDLNLPAKDGSSLSVHVNGRLVGDEPLRRAVPHWGAYPLDGVLRPGVNRIALGLPQGFLGYRVYLSRTPPRGYPHLDAGGNARWSDFCDWRGAVRGEAVRRGMEMIRGADAERPIIAMSPDGFIDAIKPLCEAYGARFHNTGHMAGFWNDYLAMLMRGSGLPLSVEPGGPARGADGFRRMMGLYLTEGVNAVHYFIHIGDVLWDAGAKAEFERLRPLLGTIGKVHVPRAEVAVLLSERSARIAGYPWRPAYDDLLPGGYWIWRFSDALADRWHIDALSDGDFASGNADRYRVVIDTNSTVMDESTVERIEAWVRRGGTFVTWAQTGRHTPEQADAWPISRLTGYQVIGVDPHDASGGAVRSRRIRVGDPAIWRPEDWPAGRDRSANGLSLRRLDPACRDLLLWEDGAVAAGMRRLGSGTVVHLGLKHGGMRGGGGDVARLLGDIVAWAGIERVGAHADGALLRHAVANNGLFDLWTLWNRDAAGTAEAVVRFDADPGRLRDVVHGSDALPRRDGSGAVLDGIRLLPGEPRSWLAPRGRIAEAALSWLDLQFAWWRAAVPVSRPLPVPDYSSTTLDLGDGWSVMPLAEDDPADPAALAAPGLDDGGWQRRPFGPWLHPEDLPSRRAMLRRSFDLPPGWGEGERRLIMRSRSGRTVAGRARFWLDGQEIAGDGGAGVEVILPRAAGRHVLAIEVRGDAVVCGPRGSVYVSFVAAPSERLDLAGIWSSSPDLLRDGPGLTLPGPCPDARLVQRDVDVPAGWGGSALWIDLRHDGGCNEILVNGTMVRRHHHGFGPVTRLDISRWLRPGASNRIGLVVKPGTVFSRLELQRR